MKNKKDKDYEKFLSWYESVGKDLHKKLDLNLLDVLWDPDNKEPVTMIDEYGNQIEFEQVATIPYEKGDTSTTYCILKPLDEMEGVADDECIIFRVGVDKNNNTIVTMEEDEKIAREVYEIYLGMLRCFQE